MGIRVWNAGREDKEGRERKKKQREKSKAFLLPTIVFFFSRFLGKMGSESGLCINNCTSLLEEHTQTKKEASGFFFFFAIY